MSKRTALLALLVTLASGAAFASPGARYEARMVYDTKTQRILMFGGITGLDAGTKLQHDLGDTWEWNGAKWVQRFTPNAPSARSSYMMVYDTNRQHTLLFGGKHETGYVNDTWKFENGAWSQINTPNSPAARVLAGAAFDPLRDRFIMYGGTGLDSTQTSFAFHDTWEFDGTTWTQIADNGPDVAKPILVYDRARKQTLMLAVDTSLVTHMHTYDPGTHTWTEKKPTLLPPCVNEGMLGYDTTRDIVLYTGGSCSTTTIADDTYEWNGDNWTKVTLISDDGRAFGGAMAYDEVHQVMTLFGGFYSTAPRYQTYLYINPAWLSTADVQPSPRSLFVFASDPDTNAVWLFGGTSMGNSASDLWKYQNGHFEAVSLASQPTVCSSAMGAYDLDRKKLVVFCGTIGNTVEFDPANALWTAVTPKHAPVVRSFGSMVYDQNLKKSVLFGGYDASGNFRDDTWLWDGTDWTQVTKLPPPSRELASMWYDPILQKTVIFGGLGRLTVNDRLTRYNDMWQFDGVSWVEIKPTALPGARYGAPVAVDPRNGHTFLFGGLQLTGTDPNLLQVYAGDTWEWDGTNWKSVTTDGNPGARENAGFAFDPNRKEFVMFGGYNAAYLADVWSFTGGTTWRPFADSTLRRRSAGK